LRRRNQRGMLMRDMHLRAEDLVEDWVNDVPVE